MPKVREKTILLVEDTLPLARIYEECLGQEGYIVVAEDTGEKALSFLEQFLPTAVVLDLILPDTNGLEVLEKAHARYPNLPIVVVTATNSVNVAVEAMRKGAFDFIVKPFPAARLVTTLHNAIERRALIDEVAQLRQALGQSQYFDFIGPSPAMQAIYRIIESVASSRVSVFITGETGTGKELAAHVIHKASPRQSKPFVVLDCASIPPDQIEGHIFGYVRGAFPGAVRDEPGAARKAHGGTLFLDEICELPLTLQAKLLRFLQTGEFTSLGSHKMEVADVRVVSAASRDPTEEVSARRFREDLYYRLHVIPIEMPPLREREDDILLLAQHFLAKFGAEENKNFTGLDPAVAGLFRSYDWPGNVRQLENVIRNVVVLNNGPLVTTAMLPEDLHGFMEESPLPANENAFDLAFETEGETTKPLWAVERDAIMEALQRTQQDIPQAASLLEISPSMLYRKLQSWRDMSDRQQKTGIRI